MTQTTIRLATLEMRLDYELNVGTCWHGGRLHFFVVDDAGVSRWLP